MKNNIKIGILLMVIATLCFGVMDGVSRYLAESYNVFIINMLRSWVLAFLVLLFACRKNKGIKTISKSKKPFLQFFRGLLLISCVCIGVYSFTKLGLVTSHCIISVYPLIVLSLSGYFLGETIGWRRWTAVFIGFFGVLVIFNPASITFEIQLLWPISLSILLATYSILTRKVSEFDNAETSFFWVAIVGCIVMTIIGPFFWETLRFEDLYWFLLLCFLSTLGHFLFIKALETTQASILQPFTYLQLFFASFIGISFFNDIVTESIIVGGIMIVGSGIFASIRTYKINKN